MSQGRVELAFDAYVGALRLDPKHAAARQALIALLMGRGRTAEAQGVLREGLAALPDNTAWAMLLARLQVEGGDRAGALATLRLLTRQSSFPNAGRQTSGLPAKTRSERRIRNNHLRVTLASGVNTKMFRPVARDGAFRGPLAVSFSGRLTKWRPPTTQPATSTRCFRTRGLSRRMSTPSR